MPVKKCALAAFGLLTACSSGTAATAPVDGGRPVTDALPESGDASHGPGDATVGGGDASDAQVPSEDGTSSACANGAVPPSTLACTGLYADIVTKTLAPGVRFYAPAVPLWSDAAQKGRWIQLPAGTQIDASDPNEWTFPVGTKVWKEFSKAASGSRPACSRR